MDEADTVARRRFGAGPKADRADFERMTELQSREFAEREAVRLRTADLLAFAPTLGGGPVRVP